MPEEEKPKANAPRCYAVERLAVIRSEIIRSSAEMLTERAKVEKYREVDPAKAQESYLNCVPAYAFVPTVLSSEGDPTGAPLRPQLPPGA